VKFDRLSYFSADENWGDPLKMDDCLLIKLDSFRGRVGVPFVVTYGTQGEHTPNSSHYKGLAVDGVFKNPKVSILEMLFMACRINFHGIGYYPNWELNGKVVGGWHLDMAPDRVAMWLGIEENNTRKYYPMTLENLKKFKII